MQGAACDRPFLVFVMRGLIMADVNEVCCGALTQRIETMRALILAAETCLSDGDFLQCAVRLQCAAKEAQFDELLMNVFDAASDK